MHDPHLLFGFASNAVLPFWALLILAPRWRVTRLLVHSVVPALVFGALYAWCLLLSPGGEGGGFGSLSAVAALFSQPAVLTAGWIHYLVFDLFVGAWIARDAERLSIPHWSIVPLLVLTFLLGPLGLVGYALLRGPWRRRASLEETPLTPERAKTS